MRFSNWIGLTTGWLITSVGVAIDVGAEDVIFYPSLVLGLPALIGLVMTIQKFRKASPPQSLQLGRLVGFGILGVVLMTLATLGLITAFFWGQPLPQG